MGSVSKWKAISGRIVRPEKELDLAQALLPELCARLHVDLIISFRDTDYRSPQLCYSRCDEAGSESVVFIAHFLYAPAIHFRIIYFTTSSIPISRN